MFESCLEKQKELIAQFKSCKTAEEKYQLIIELGKTQNRLAEKDKTEENFVRGCQSRLFIKSHFDKEKGVVFFESDADALISAGLGILLVKVYSGESPETILKCPPSYIEELSIHQTLTPGRANGLAAVYVRLKQDALKYFIEQHRTTG